MLVYCCLKQMVIICDSRITDSQIARATAFIQERKELQKAQCYFDDEVCE